MECNFPINNHAHVCLVVCGSVGWMVGCLVSWMVCHDFLKWQEVTRSYHSTCLSFNFYIIQCLFGFFTLILLLHYTLRSCLMRNQKMPLEYQSLKDNKAAMAGQFYKQNLLHLTIYTVFEKYLKIKKGRYRVSRKK